MKLIETKFMPYKLKIKKYINRLLKAKSYKIYKL